MSNSTRMGALAYNEPQSGEVECTELVQLVQKGNVEAFDAIVRNYQDRVFNTALRLVGNLDDAADVTQEVFLNCFRKIDSFRGDSQFTTWIYRITVNVVKNRWKYNERRGANKTSSLHAKEDPEDLALEERLQDSNPGPRQIAGDRELYSILLEKMNTMHAEYREVLVLRSMENLSYEEIAEILSCSIGTVKSRIHRAREILREQMKDFI